MIEALDGNTGMWLFNGGGATYNSYKFKNSEALNSLVLKDHIEWLKQHTVLFHREGDYFFVHAGITPYPLNEQSDFSMVWNRDWIDYDGEFAENVFVVHGHTPVPFVQLNKNQINIDTGCVFKDEPGYGKLTAVRLGPNRDDIKVFETKED